MPKRDAKRDFKKSTLQKPVFKQLKLYEKVIKSVLAMNVLARSHIVTQPRFQLKCAFVKVTEILTVRTNEHKAKPMLDPEGKLKIKVRPP